MNKDKQLIESKTVTLKGLFVIGLIVFALSGFLFVMQFANPPKSLVGEVLNISQTEISLGHARDRVTRVELNEQITASPEFSEIEVGMFVRVTGKWKKDERGVYVAEKLRVAHKKRK